MLNAAQASLLKSQVNTAVGILFIASFALGAGLMIWNVASDENPLANVMAAHMQAVNMSS